MIPKGWEKKSLAHVAFVQTGLAKGPKGIKDSVELPYLRVANVQDGYLDLTQIKTIKTDRSKVSRYSLQRGDVLMTEGGDFDKLGRGAVWNEQITPCLHQNHVFAVRPDPAVLMSEFLSMLTGSSYGKTYFLSCSKQSTNLASINSSQLKKFPVLLPPLPEQKAIAEVLSVWDRAIEKTERLIQAKEKRFAGLVSRLLCNPEFKLGYVRDFTTEISVRNKGTKINRVLSVTNHSGFVLPEDQFERSVASSDLSNYKVVTSGQYAYNPSRINVGSIARLDGWNEGVLSPMYVVFSIDNAMVDSDFFQHWLSSNEAKQRIAKSAQGSVRETVGFADLGSIPFPIPEMSEQKRIAETLNLAQREIDLLKKLTEKQKLQKRGLMQKLLTGEWRVGKECEAGLARTEGKG